MSKLNELEKKISLLIKNSGYNCDIKIEESNRPDLGDYQINDAMKMAKEYHKSPVVIANDIITSINECDEIKEVTVAGAGFINIKLSDKFLIEYTNEIKDSPEKNIEKMTPKTIIVDYGGANVAKALHVGHLRPANIGEAMKRIALLLGNKVIGDVHFGDAGLQVGIVVAEMQERYPDLICFKEDYNGEEFDLPITNKDLSEIYPTGSSKSKTDETFYNKAKEITCKIQSGEKGYSTLWNKISELSKTEIKKTYDYLNANFDLWEGEKDSFKYIPELLETLNKKNLLYISDGATVMDVKEETDTVEMPPILIKKSDGAYLYATTDLATILGRIKRFNPDEIWYTTDIRQELHFTQVFRAAKISNIANENLKLGFYGFGTMNGKDGKPFKTRDGGVLPLEELINQIKNECSKRLNRNIVEEQDEEKTIDQLALATIKYADLLPHRTSDYIFDIEKFCDLEGKTGSYLLYSTVRIKSLLRKAKEENYNFNNFNKIKGDSDKEVILCLMKLANVITKAYESKSFNELAEYIYKLTSAYNKFYAENKIMTEQDEELKESWLVLSQIVHDTNIMILDVMGINCPEKM